MIVCLQVTSTCCAVTICGESFQSTMKAMMLLLRLMSFFQQSLISLGTCYSTALSSLLGIVLPSCTLPVLLVSLSLHVRSASFPNFLNQFCDGVFFYKNLFQIILCYSTPYQEIGWSQAPKLGKGTCPQIICLGDTLRNVPTNILSQN